MVKSERTKMKQKTLSYFLLNGLLVFSFIASIIFFLILEYKYYLEQSIGNMIMTTIGFIFCNLCIIAVIQYNEG